MNTILIIYDASIESDIIINRIKSLGKTYMFWGNHWLVKTNFIAKEVYEHIVTNGYEGKNIFVVRIDNRASLGYWGIMNKTLWEWLKKEDNSFDSFGK